MVGDCAVKTHLVNNDFSLANCVKYRNYQTSKA